MSDDNNSGSHIHRYVGYYEWEGLPCRIRKDEENPQLLHAEMYVPGKGFVPADSIDIYFKGHMLDERHYRDLLLTLTIKKRYAH